MLMEIGVLIGKLKDKYLTVLPSLPTEFTTEIKLINFLRILREFLTYQMMNRLDYTELDQYNESLSKNNIAYRSPSAVRAFEDYV